MALYYHGTVQTFLPGIKKDGLKIEAAHAWKIHFSKYGEMTPNPDKGSGVYVTKSKDHAQAYAQTRADYFGRNPGECFEMFETADDKKKGYYLFLSKDKDAPVLHTVPILLTLDIDTSTIPLEADPEDSEYGLICHRTIPASSIVEISKLPKLYDDSAFDKNKRKAITDAGEKAMFGADADLMGMLLR